MKVVDVAKPGAYHHGDLRDALIDATTALAREGGPDAVVLREAARRVGVSAAAAYHHFANRDQLNQAVKQRALAILTGRMQSALAEDEQVRVRHRNRQRIGAADVARHRLRTLGLAYLSFAFDEPGLFRLAFGPRGSWPTRESASPHDHNAGPFLILGQVLDELVAACVLPPERRPGLEYIAWAEVHGVAALCLDGPLAQLDLVARRQIIDRALGSIIRGL
jgi:AcrR family transcriptional regulator